MVGLWQPNGKNVFNGANWATAAGFGSGVGPGALQQLRLQQAESHVTAAGAAAAAPQGQQGAS